MSFDPPLPSRTFPHSIPLPKWSIYRTIQTSDVFPWVWSLFRDTVYQRRGPVLCGIFDHIGPVDPGRANCASWKS